MLRFRGAASGHWIFAPRDGARGLLGAPGSRICRLDFCARDARKGELTGLLRSPTREKVSIPTLDKRSARAPGGEGKANGSASRPFPPSSANSPAGRHRLRGRRRDPAGSRPAVRPALRHPHRLGAGRIPRRHLPLAHPVRRRVRAGPRRIRRSGQRQGPGGELDQRHAHRPRPAQLVHERQGVPGHAGADQGRVRRPGHRGHPGERLHQGDLADRRHAGRQGGHQGGRHHHRDRRQDRRRASA